MHSKTFVNFQQGGSTAKLQSCSVGATSTAVLQLSRQPRRAPVVQRCYVQPWRPTGACYTNPIRATLCRLQITIQTACTTSTTGCLLLWCLLCSSHANTIPSYFVHDGSSKMQFACTAMYRNQKILQLRGPGTAIRVIRITSCLVVATACFHSRP